MSHEAIWFLKALVEVLIDGTDTGRGYDASMFTYAPTAVFVDVLVR